jgi:uncharacterized membrane protein YbhN (UPF0104 family)
MAPAAPSLEVRPASSPAGLDALARGRREQGIRSGGSPVVTAVPDAELALPAFDVRALARRAALPAAVAVALVAFLVAAGGPLQAFADAISRALDADPRWVIAAAGLEILSFTGYIALLWLVASRATDRMGPRESAEVALGGAAASRLLPTGGAGGVALTLWALRRSGLPSRAATRTLLSFLVLLYSIFLGSIAIAGGVISVGLVHGDAPLALSAIPAALAAVAIGLALFIGLRPAGPRRLHGRVGSAANVLGGAVRDSIGLLRSADPRLLGAPLWWAADAAVLYAMLNAFGAAPSFAVVVLVYFLGQVFNTLPLPGAVSGGMVGVLLAFGVETDLALVSVLAYRAVAIWLPAPAGLIAIGGLRKTVARWGRETAAPAPAPVPAPAPSAAPARERRTWPYPEPAAA